MSGLNLDRSARFTIREQKTAFDARVLHQLRIGRGGPHGEPSATRYEPPVGRHLRLDRCHLDRLPRVAIDEDGAAIAMGVVIARIARAIRVLVKWHGDCKIRICTLEQLAVRGNCVS